MKTTFPAVCVLALAGGALSQAASFSDDFESYTAGQTIDSLADWTTVAFGNAGADSAIASFGGSLVLDPPGGNLRHVVEASTIQLNAGEDFSGSLDARGFANGHGLIFGYVDSANYLWVDFYMRDAVANPPNDDSVRLGTVVGGVETVVDLTPLTLTVGSGVWHTLNVGYTASTGSLDYELVPTAGGAALASGSTTVATDLSGQFGVRIQFSGASTFDNFAVTTVPEPGTWAMLVSGAGLLGLALRRRH